MFNGTLQICFFIDISWRCLKTLIAPLVLLSSVVFKYPLTRTVPNGPLRTIRLSSGKNITITPFLQKSGKQTIW